MWGDLAEFCEGAEGFIRQRIDRNAQHDGEEQDGDAKAARHGVEPIEDVEERLCQEVENAKIDDQVKMRRAKAVFIKIKHVQLFRAGEEVLRIALRGAGGDGHGFAQYIGLIAAALAFINKGKAKGRVLRLVRDDPCEPVFLRDPNPAALRLDLALSV